MSNINIVTKPPISEPRIFDSWPRGYYTASFWKYNFGRRIKRGEISSVVAVGGGHIPVYCIEQTEISRRQPTELQIARTEYLRRFWLHARHDLYLWCDNGVSTIDCNRQQANGRIVPWFGEDLLEQHLRGESVYGVFAEGSRLGRPARTYWVAVDLDLHLPSGGNLELFWEQVNAILPCVWGRNRCQIAMSPDKVNGLHIYLFFNKPIPLAQAQKTMRKILQTIHADHPELKERVDAWNAKLKSGGQNSSVRQCPARGNV